MRHIVDKQKQAIDVICFEIGVAWISLFHLSEILIGYLNRRRRLDVVIRFPVKSLQMPLLAAMFDAPHWFCGGWETK